MRVALIAESFLPQMNGVVNSVLHVLRELRAAGHETLVVAPEAPAVPTPAVTVSPGRVTRLPSLPLPSYPDVRVAFATGGRITRILADFRPDVLHLASPFVLGWQALAAADALRIPAVAVYQTDIIAYTERYGVAGTAPLAAAHVARLHRRATLTLAPSSAAEEQLTGLGVDRLRRWGRGVDAEGFSPQRRSPAWRDGIAPGELLVGYVGRLAAEKQVQDLRVLCDLPGVRLVIIGDGPERDRLERTLPGAVFTGHLAGEDLTRAMASLDVFVHPGESETFCQTVQEALAAGVPVVATGRGGPRDLVRSSVDGWLYRPGDLADLRARVADLTGDASKRRSFGHAARESVRERTWQALTGQLERHYADAGRLRPIDDALMARGEIRPELPVSMAALRGLAPARPDTPPRTSATGETAAGTRPRTPAPGRTASRAAGASSSSPDVPPAGRRTWRRFVALGDSLTEGLCDASRVPDGEYRGWADRVAMLLAQGGGGPFRYANLAVRSRRVRDLAAEQVPRALELRPELVSILMGANDLVGHGADPLRLADQLAEQVVRIRRSGADVLLVTPFLPRRRAAMIFARRFASFASEMRRIARETGSGLLDIDALPELAELEMWADDKVHLCSRGHRFLAYRAAEVLGIPDAEALGGLDDALHADDPPARGWVRHHALPWVWRRLRGRTAGDGRHAKHDAYVTIPGRGTVAGDSSPRTPAF